MIKRGTLDREVMRYDVCMKRTTIMLPDDTAARLAREARRRGVSVAAVVRDAVERHVPAQPPQPLAFFAVGEGGPADASERVDEIVGKALRKQADRR